MGLLPLEFTDSLVDSPYFRKKLHDHEEVIEKTSHDIKTLLKEIKDLLVAARNLSSAHQSLAHSLKNFRFESIGSGQTDDELVIANSLNLFGNLLLQIEEERTRMLDQAQRAFIKPIEAFRKDNLGQAKDAKKKFDKETAKFCQSLDKHLNLTTKKSENQLQEADASVEMEKRHFTRVTLEYISLLQEVQEKKKFEFVETVLSFMLGWLTFYHQGYEVFKEFKTTMTDLQVRIQNTRENFLATHQETEQLKQKLLEMFQKKTQDPGTLNKMYTRQGYLFLMEKKALGTTWTKYFCMYQKPSKMFTMIPYTQSVGKIGTSDTVILKDCVRRMTESIEKRFCFDIIPADRSTVYTFQALSEEDQRAWLNTLDGKEPTNNNLGKSPPHQEEYKLNESGFSFVRKCIDAIEARGLEDQGLYRLVGVNSKVTKLIQTVLDQKQQINWDDPEEWEVKTITSSLKNYLRNLPEPLMTYKLHNAFIMAAKREKSQRLEDIHSLIHHLPPSNFEMLKILVQHLSKVAKLSQKNLMTVSNLGVCFGPTLLRPEEETVAAIMDIKFANIVVEILIGNCDKMFNTSPQGSLPQSSLKEEHVPSRDHFVHKEVNSKMKYPPSTPSYPKSPVPSEYISTNPNIPLQQQWTTSFSTPEPTTLPVNIPVKSVKPNCGVQKPQHSTQKHSNVPLAVFNPWEDNQPTSSSSSSTESLLTAHSKNCPEMSKLNNLSGSSGSRAGIYMSGPGLSPHYENVKPRSSSLGTEIPNGNKPVPSSRMLNRKEDHVISNSKREIRSNSGSVSSNSGSVSSEMGRKVRTLYACIGENDSELSFQPNQVIYNVRPSKEIGWLEGCLHGRIGLIPENYVADIS